MGDDTFTGGTGKDVMRYTNILDGHDTFIGFDGNPAGGQDALDLISCSTVSACSRLTAPAGLIVDNGASVDSSSTPTAISSTGFELTVATLKTADIITVGPDILVGICEAAGRAAH